MSSKSAENTRAEIGNELPVVVFEHSLRRIEKRFSLEDPEEVREGIGGAVEDPEEGALCLGDDDVLIQHGSLVAIGVLEDRTLAVRIACNFSRGASRGSKKRLPGPRTLPRPSPRVLLPAR